MPNDTLTAGRARELFHYDPETGALTWRVTKRSRRAGTVAGSIWKDAKRGRRYWDVKADKVRYRAHRVIWLWMTGEWPIADVDHIDGDGLNNRWSNLRGASRSQNLGNSQRKRNNALGVKGVIFNKSRNKFQAQICHKGKYRMLGLFDSIEQAAAAYASAARHYFGEFARTA